MVGGAGNDVYLVDNAGDVVTEAAGQGTDEVRTALAAYTLGANVETLTYTGTGPFSGGGNALDNRLAGAGGDDSLSGFAGDDTLIGAAGADTLDGGSGTDTASYADAASGVVADLASGSGTAGEATGDVLVSIENLTGSAYADTLSGDGTANRLDGGAGADSLSGGAGNDTLIGGAGADAIDGGAGSDTASYATASAGVAVDLASGTGTAGDAAGDALSGIENVTGGAGNDTLRGDGGANLLDGGVGDDRLEGRGGNDTLIGGSGTDTAIFSGNVRDYAATLSGATWTIQALSGADGTDTLQGVEIAQFADATIRLDANNAPLIPNDLSAATNEDAAPLVVDLLQGAWDFEGSALSATGLVQTGGPTATVSLSGGALSLNPNPFNSLAAGQTAALTFAYAVSDGSASTARTLSVTVAGRNDAPAISAPLTATTNEDAAPLVVNLLQGATDPDQGDTLNVTGFTQTGGRTVSVTRTGGALTLDPAQFNDLAAGESAVLTFAYGVTDGAATTAQTLNVTVQGRNDAPVAGADTLSTPFGTMAVIAPSTLLSNDVDPDHDPLSVSAVGNASHGVVTRDSAGRILFTPDVGFTGNAGFDYTINDGLGGAATGRATMVVASPSAGGARNVTSLVAGSEVRDAGGSVIDEPIEQSYVAVLADGGYVKVWWTAETNSSDVYARRYNADGSAAGSAFMVNTTTALDQGGASVAALADGGFVVSWHSVNGSWRTDTQADPIQQQRFDGAGVRIGTEEQVNTDNVHSKNFPVTTGLADGGWVTVWNSVNQEGASSGWGAYGQRYDAAGHKLNGEFRVNSTVTGDQCNPTVTALADGGFLVAWDSRPGQDGSGSGVYQQRYDVDGQKVGGEARVNVTTANDQQLPSVTALPDGGWAVAWNSLGQDGSYTGAYGRVYNADGTARSGEVQLHQTTIGYQSQEAIQALADGSLIAMWTSFDATAQTFVIEGRRFDAQGTALGGEFQVSDGRYPAPANGYRSYPSIAARSDGGFVAYWQDPTSTTSSFITKTFAPSSQAPVVLGRNGTLGQGAAEAGTALFDASHIQGAQWVGGALQQLTQYEFVDTTPGAATGYLTVNGVRQMAGTAVSVAASELGQVGWHAGSGFGTDTIQIRAYDGRQWSDWTPSGMTTTLSSSTLVAGSEVRDAGGSVIDEPIEQSYVAVLADGGYVKVWWTAETNSSDVYARRYNADGSAAGSAFMVNTTTALDQGGASVAALADGGFVVSWHSVNGSWRTDTQADPIQQQRFDGAGVRIGTEEQVNTDNVHSKNFPVTTGLADGGWVTVWNSVNQEGASSGWGAYGQRYDAAGHKLNGEFRVNSTVTGDQCNPTVTALADGGFLVAWDSRPGQDGSGSGVYQQRYDVDGQKVGGEARVNVTTANDQQLPSVTALPDGGWAVAWNSLGQDGSYTGAYGRVYNADGTARSGEVQLHQTTIGYQSQEAIQALADGSLIAMWTSFDATAQTFVIEGRRFDAQGTALGGEFQVSDGRYPAANGYRSYPSIAARSDGGFVAYWQDPTSTTSSFITKTFAPSSQTVGSYTGTNGADVIFGSSGVDTLTSGTGTDAFLFTTPTQGLDTITDFQPGQDRIEVVGAAFGGLPTGSLDAGRFALNAPADADNRFVFNTTTGALSYDPDGNGAMAATTIALLNVRTLAASDIWVVAPT